MANHSVFISHSGTDTWVARQISHACIRSGANTFLDEAEITVGADFETVILDALDKASELLVLLTPWALERRYVWLEIGAAWNRRIPIIGVLYGMSAAEFQTTAGIPVLLKQRNLIDINSIDRYFEELKTRAASNHQPPIATS